MKFYLKNSGKESNPALIMGKLYDAQFSDGRFVYSTGERILPGQWDAKKSKPKKGNEALVGRLLEISKQATDYIRLNRSNLTKEGLKGYLDGLRPKEEKKAETGNAPETMLALWKELLNSIEGTVEPQTFKIYRNSCECFQAFLGFNKWQNITPEKFTIIHFNKYHSYLKEKYKPNTVAKRLKHFKSCLTHITEDLKLPLGFNLNKVTYKETAGLKLSLSEDELQAYIDADLPEHLLKVRDLAVLQCATGLRVSDRRRIDKNLRVNKIVIEAKKTRAGIEIPITPAIRAILEKYNYELPNISEQKYREGIKAIHKKLFPDQTVQVREGNEFKDVFVHEEISTHDMVRTFITLSADHREKCRYVAQKLPG
jgi:site-specific recombinase XerD